MKRRVLSLMMALVIFFTMLPTSALAQDIQTPAASAPTVEDTKDVPKVTDPTTAPTVADTTPTVADTTPTESGAAPIEGDIAPQNAAPNSSAVAKVGDTEYDTVQEILEEMGPVEITLLGNVTEDITVYAATTIHMGGFSITGAIEAEDSLTLKGGTVKGTVKMDGGTFTMTAPADAAAAIDGGLNVISGSCSVSGAKIGVKGALTFGGDDMVITGTEKAVALNSAAGSKTFYGSATESGAAATEAVFEDGTYKVGGEVAKKLSSKQADAKPTEPVTLTLTPTEQAGKAGTTITFTAAYDGTDELNVYVQGNSLEDYYFTFDQTDNGDGTHTITVKIDADVPTGDYTLYVHEVKDAFVQAKATITVTGLPDVAEVGGVKYKSLPKALAAAKDGDTVTMLADHETDWDAVDAGDESTLAIVTKKLTLDLNGKTVDYLMVGDIVFDEETQTITAVYPGDLTVMSSREGGTVASTINALDFVNGTLEIQSGQIGDYNGGQLTCNGDSGRVTISGGTVLGLTVGEGASVTVSSGSRHAGNWFNDGTLNITGGTFNGVIFNNRNGTIAISGGTFGSIRNRGSSGEIPPMLLLAKGYAFYDQYDDTLKDGSVRDALKNVTVKPHTHNIENGKCACGLTATVSDSKGDFYNTLQAALDAAAKDSTIEWVQPEQDLTEQVTFDAADAVVTVRMNGKTLTAPNNDAPAVAVSSGTLIFADAATISMPTNADPYNQKITYAVSISGGKLVFQGKLTAEGGVFNIPGNRTVQMPAVYANGGELDFQGDLDLKSGLTISGTAKLTRKLTKGTFRTDYMEGDRLSVTGASNYKYLEDLLEDGYAFVDKDDPNVFRCVSSFTFWSGSDVTIVPHTHTWGPDGELYSCTACGKSCGHPDGYPDGKCPVCGKSCPHAIADQSPVDHKYYCNECHQQMVARIQTDTYAWSHFTNLTDAMAAVEDGQTILLLADVQHNDSAFVIDADGNNKTVTLDLNGHTIAGSGSIDIGKQFRWPEADLHAPATLKIVGTGSILTQYALGVFELGTLDLTGWAGGTINIVTVSRNGNTGKEGTLTVGETAGHINKVEFYSWPSTQITNSKLYGGSYGKIDTLSFEGVISLGDVLPAGYAFRYADGTYAPATASSLSDVTVVKCDHGGENGFDYNSLTCPYCGAPAVAQTALNNVDGFPWRNFADLQTALDADRQVGSTLRLLADVTGEYTIDGSQDTGIDLNGCSIHGTVYVTGEKGDEETAFSNSKSTGTIQEVVAHANANLAVSGAAAIIEKLTLAEGATWENILFLPRNPGYKVYTNYPDLSSYKWYAPAEVSDTLTALNNVSIERLPITSNTLYMKVDGKNVTSVERGTTVQLLAYCNTSGADVNFSVGERESDGTFSFSKLTSEYKKIGSTWYYVTECTFNEIGEYGIYFTASKDGYLVASELKTLTVTKLKLSNAKIEFPNGNESVYRPYNTTGVPPYVVTYNGSELKEGVDYTVVRGDSRSTVGTATLTIKATDDGDYAGQKTARWKVVAHKATISVGDIIKAYDGTTDLPANVSIKFKSADSRYAPSGGPLPLLAGEDYQILNASYDSANASEDEKTVSFTIKLTDRNYTFEDGTMQKDFVLNGADVSQTFKINQATVTPADEITQLVFNDLERTYEIDLRAFLPKLPVGCEYGKILNRGCDFHFTDSTYLDSNNYIFVSNEGILTLPIVSAHSTDVNGQIGTITVPIVSANYRQFDLTIKVVIGQRIPLDQSGVSVSATDITYGQTLAESTLTATGSMICPRMKTEIPGTFAWTDGTIKPNAGSYEAEWTFTPAEGYEEYAPATGKVTITVSPKSIEGAVINLKQTSYVYTGSDIRPELVSVVLDGVTLECGRDKDYYYGYSYGKDVWTYGFSIEGFNNYTGNVTVNWYITPREVTPTIEVARCTYTGDALEPTVTLTDDLGNIIAPKEYTISYENNINAGKGRVTITDKEGGNYVIKGISQDFPISQAAAPTNIQTGTLNVVNGIMRTYTYDFSQLLPAAPKGEYGTISYRSVNVRELEQGYSVDGTARIDEATGALTLPFRSVWNVSQLPPGSSVGTVSIYVITQNFEAFLLELKLYPIDQIKPVQDGDITATEITYGDALSKSEISGSMKDPDTGETVTGTFAWTDGTVTPDAGSYEAEWTFTPDESYGGIYAPVTGKVTINVSKAKLTGVSVSQNGTLFYSGQPQSANVTATAATVDGTSVEFRYSDHGGGSFDTTVPAFTEAGTYTVYYHAGDPAENHEISSGTFTVTIAPLPISLLSVERISKTYDGTANVTLSASRLTFFSKTASRSGITLPDTALTFSDAQFTMKQADESYLPSPEVGNGKALSFTMTLANDNYVFEGEPEGTKTISDTFATDDTTRFTITKADAPVPTDGTLTIINGLERTYEVDLAALLSALESPKSYGDIAYGAPTITVDAGYCDAATAKIENGKLILPILANPVNTEGNVGSVTVIVTTSNYDDITLTVNIFAKNKAVPVLDGEVTASEITYGQPLNASTITGKMKDPDTGKEIPGTFTWTDGTLLFNAGSRKAEWTFTPDAPEYAAATGNVRVTVNPKSIVGAIVTLEDSFVYDGTEKLPKIISVVLDGVTLTGVGRGTDYGYSCNRTSQVGTYYDDFAIGGLGNYTGEIKFTWSVTPREVTPTITVADGVYDGGNPVQPTVTLTDDLGNTIDPKEYDVSYSDNLGAGTGTVTVTDKEGGNYVLGTASTTFTIAKATAPALTAHRVTQKYSLKTEQTITLPDLKSLGMPDDAQVSDANAFHSGSYSPAGKIQDGWGIDVNTGAITYALADGAAAGDVITFTLLVRSKNYEDATVTVILTLTERDAPILTLPDIITVDYTGAEIPVSAVTGKSAAFNGVDVPGTWGWKDGQAITNATDTGSKTIVFTPDDSVNYHPVEGTVFVIISRVAPTYTAPAAIDGLTYNGSAQALVKAGSTAHGKLLYSLSKDGAYSETIPTGTDAGEYTVWYKVEGDSNHKDSQPESVTATIAPKTVTATVTVSGGSLTYTGDPLKPDVIVKDGDTVISPDEYEISYKDNVNAGTATVTIKNKAGGNYTVSGSTTFEIGKAASEVKTAPTANTGLVYNGGEQTLITAGTALGGKLKYRLGETGEFTTDLPKATDAGTYTVYYMVEGDSNHRDSDVQSLTVTIDKAKVTVKALDKSIYTDDKAPDLSKPVLDKDYTVSGMFGEDELTGDIRLTYVDANGTEITPDTTKVGKVIIRASGLTAPNGNYTVVFVDGTLTIDERPVYTIKATAGIHGSITPSGDIDVLHGGSQTFTIAANSGYAISNVKIDGVSIGAVKSYTFENVTGNHTIEVTFMKANGNPQTGVMVDEITGEYYVG